MGSSTTAGTAAKKALVEITYKHQDEHLAYHGHERVDKLLEEAIERFDVEQGQDLLALFTADDRELDGHDTLHEAAVGPGDHLFLRSKVINIIYNGREEEFAYKGGELVSELLKQALSRFGITSNAHLMSLFDEANVELKEDISVREAKVHAGETLVLRQSTVKGG